MVMTHADNCIGRDCPECAAVREAKLAPRTEAERRATEAIVTARFGKKEARYDD